MNILIIGGSGKAPGANSVCVRNMAQEFMVQGHRVWNISDGEDYVREPGDMDGVTLWQVPEGFYGKLLKEVTANPILFRRIWLKVVGVIRHLLLLPLYPITEPGRTLKVVKRAKKIVKENDITLVIAIYNGFANIYAGMKLKKMYGAKLKVVSYHLDLRTASVNNSALVRQYIHRHALQSLVKESQIVDKMLIPYSGKEETEKVKGLEKEKIIYVGFPVYVSDGEVKECELPFDDETINISYIGTLSEDNRNPRYVLGLLEQVSNMMSRKIMVHVWGDAGGMDAELNASPIACYHGKIDNRYVRYIMNKSDFLLNMGNAVAYDMLPSKVFGMFATGKPIINVITHPKDATLPFFEKYNHSINIKEYKKEEQKTSKVKEELELLNRTALHNTDGMFDDFKPETICNIILN